jgi:hypothetical protein
MIVYHATDKENLQNILNNGFDLNKVKKILIITIRVQVKIKKFFKLIFKKKFFIFFMCCKSETNCLSEGENELKIISIDRAGNSTELKRKVTYQK